MQKNTKCDITKERKGFPTTGCVAILSTCPRVKTNVYRSYNNFTCEMKRDFRLGKARLSWETILLKSTAMFEQYLAAGSLLRCSLFLIRPFTPRQAVLFHREMGDFAPYLMNEVIYGFNSFTHYCAGISRIRRISRGLINSVVQRFARKKAHPWHDRWLCVSIDADIVLSNILYSKER